MRLRTYCVVSSLIFFGGCFAGESKSDAPISELQKSDKKDAKKADAKEDDGVWGDPPDSMDTGEPIPVTVLEPCPEGKGRMENGSCAPEEEFYGEQEALDAEALLEMEDTHDPKAQGKAREVFIEQQIRQTEQVEKNLDEIIGDLKQKKAKGFDKKGEM